MPRKVGAMLKWGFPKMVVPKNDHFGGVLGVPPCKETPKWKRISKSKFFDHFFGFTHILGHPNLKEFFSSVRRSSCGFQLHVLWRANGIGALIAGNIYILYHLILFICCMFYLYIRIIVLMWVNNHPKHVFF